MNGKISSTMHRLLALALFFSLPLPALACTGITLHSSGGNTVVARTVEWSGSDNLSRYVIVPRGHEWTSFTPDGSKGRRFKAKYGYAGLAVQQAEFIVEGLNEKGLSAGLFYFPDYGKYEDFNPSRRDECITDLQLVSFVLASCSNVEEVMETLDKTLVHGIYPGSSTAHWRFTEQGGRQVVLEIIDGKQVFYDNPLGVLTNSPSLPWQLTNLNNYVNLQSGNTGPSHIGKLDLKPFGGGSGMLGLPGDLTPPSRFVRAAFYQNTAPVLESSRETVFQAFHILNNFDLPIGMQTLSGETPTPIPSATQWTSASDLVEGKLYFKTMYNNTIRCIDLSGIDFARVRYVDELMDPVHEQPVKQILP